MIYLLIYLGIGLVVACLGYSLISANRQHNPEAVPPMLRYFISVSLSWPMFFYFFAKRFNERIKEDKQ